MKIDIAKELGLSLGLESAETPNTEEVNSFDFTPETEHLSNDRLENLENEHAEDEIIQEAEDAIETAETVDELVVAVESFALANKPMDRFLAVSVGLVLSNTRNKYKDPMSLLPACESYDADPIGNTTLALESLKQVAKDGWLRLKETVKQIIDSLMLMLQGWLGTAGKLHRRVVKLQEALRERSKNGGTVPGNVAVNAKAIGIDGKVTPEIVKVGLFLYRDILGSVFNSFGSEIDDLEKNTMKRVDQDNTGNDTIKHITEVTKRSFDKLESIMSPLSKSTQMDGARTLAVPGNISISEVEFGRDGLYTLEINRTGASDDVQDEGGSTQGAEAPTDKEMAEMLKMSAEIARQLKTQSSGLGRAFTKVGHAYDLSRKFDSTPASSGDDIKGKLEKEREEANALKRQKEFVLVLTKVSGFILKANRSALSFMGNALDYIENSINAHEVEGDSRTVG